MKELIPVNQTKIGDDIVQSVNARDLHAFLEVKTEFKDWIARRIKEYGFIENKDFCSFLSESTGGRPSKEYAITLDMAKELSMVERNKKGKEARQYFIAVEKAYREEVSRGQLTGPQVDTIQALAIVRDVIGTVPGVKPAILNAKYLEAVHLSTGLAVEPFRLALPPQEEPANLNPTNLGKLVGMSAREVNLELALRGLQFKNERGEWELTDQGREYAEAYPFARNGHASYQILWQPKTQGLLA